MTWTEALVLMKSGKAVKRPGWSGNKFLYYVPAMNVPAMTMSSKKFADKNGRVQFKEFIAIHTKEGMVGLYATTQCDMLASDWVEYEI